jgi:hypothetical protein
MQRWNVRALALLVALLVTTLSACMTSVEYARPGQSLDATQGSWELRPDMDGTLTLWLSPGDYALFGGKDDPSGPAAPTLAVVALLRVPSGGPVVYAGELTFAEDFREGRHADHVFGAGSVTTDSMAEAIRKVEAMYGTLPAAPALSSWCVGEDLPSGNSITEFVSQSRRLLDAGCSASP